MSNTSYLPAPEQLQIVKMTEEEVAEEIERYIDFVDQSGRSVHLPMQFVRHFMKRDDGALPTIAAIAQLPIVLADGNILAMQEDLDRERGIAFRIPEELMKVLPKREDCTPAAVAEAMRFLCDEWLCDILADYVGKCILIADALTLIERSMLAERPVFFITAGRRGGGKTTTLHMLIMAVFGIMAPAAAWSPNEEERRKALLSYFMAGLAFIIWDNIPRGTQISCPHIERSCTTALYTDRKLGVSEMVATSASTIHHFTGNNIGPKGDLASRSLQVRLEVDRADPENRTFKHSGIGWTEAHRGQIMAALYTILLGNPVLRGPTGGEKTRFKAWWRLCGSAVENAAQQHAATAFPADANWNKACPPQKIDFKDLFLAQEEEEEEGVGLADVLELMWKKAWRKFSPTKAADVAAVINNARNEFTIEDDRELGHLLRDLLFPNLPPTADVTAKAVGRRLKARIGEPVRKGVPTYTLRTTIDQLDNSLRFFVEAKEG